jgi:hypothetical protein
VYIVFSGTYKLQKTVLQREGFDPSVVKDPIFFHDQKTGTYVRMDNDLYQSIVSGAILL